MVDSLGVRLSRQATGICIRGRFRFRSDAAVQRLCLPFGRHSLSTGVFKARGLQTPGRRLSQTYGENHFCREVK